MKLLEALDRAAERRWRRQQLLIREGLDGRSLFRNGVQGIDPRFLIASAVIGLFAWAFARSQGEQLSLMTGALVAAFAGAWGFYLGSSSGASKQAERADKAVEVASSALQKLPAAPGEPDVELGPGETARAPGEKEA